MTLTDLIPSLTGKPRPRKANRIEARLRKAQLHLAAVREDNAKLLDRQTAADDFFAILMHDVVTTNAALGLEQQLRAEAEIDRDEWRDEALALHARFSAQIAAEANATAVDVPPLKRIGCDDDTASVDVTTLWEAAEAGLLPGCGPGRLT